MMRAGRQGEANAVADQICKQIARQDSSFLRNCSHAKSSADLWKAVKQYGKRRESVGVSSNILPDDLNEHYARISTDPQYNPPRLKHSASIWDEIFTEEKVFKILDSLKVTATGLDGIPAWFLRLGAPIFSSSLAALFNLSLNKSIVPHQWKRALISPIPKVEHAKVPSDFRPISITPVMSRIMEKQFVKEFIYPSIIHPTYAPLFAVCRSIRIPSDRIGSSGADRPFG